MKYNFDGFIDVDYCKDCEYYGFTGELDLCKWFNKNVNISLIYKCPLDE